MLVCVAHYPVLFQRNQKCGPDHRFMNSWYNYLSTATLPRGLVKLFVILIGFTGFGSTAGTGSCFGSGTGFGAGSAFGAGGLAPSAGFGSGAGPLHHSC
jgi:hypothetical protein